ncbi:MAG: DUF5615 family PIN-like protein [Desulfobacca sp.]|nr:DUF5615 family PIN-like protein [Desulfobacca sp.]
MKLKLDENLGRRGVELFLQTGHDVATVSEQGLCGTTDNLLIDICRAERRCLVTLDLDFSNPLIFNPSDYAGIAVLRLPPTPSMKDILDTVRTLISGLAQEAIEGKLWIIKRGRIRIYQPE